MKDKIKEFLIIIVIIFGLFGSGVFIAAIWSEDIDAKNAPEEYVCEPERNEPERNEPIRELAKLFKEVLDHEDRLID
ncbi:hypothetical protein LCGC14_1866800, partial [marine sediment metagenome]